MGGEGVVVPFNKPNVEVMSTWRFNFEREMSFIQDKNLILIGLYPIHLKSCGLYKSKVFKIKFRCQIY
jgi:hypothetical protein